MERGVGAGIVIEQLHLKQFFHLQDHASIFQAKLFEIEETVRYIKCHAPAKLLSFSSVRLQLVEYCRRELASISGQLEFTRIWVAEHKYICGNETAMN